MTNTRSKSDVFRLLFGTAIIATVLAFATGCESNNRKSLKNQIDTLKLEKKQLRNDLEQARSENQQLTKQLQTLAGLDEWPADAAYYQLQNVSIGRYSGFYDKDRDGIKEKLIVYVVPTDPQGDAIKAPGEVDVQLWNLDQTQEKSLLRQWQVKSEQLKDLWVAGIIAVNYRLAFDVADLADQFEASTDSWTLKITFTDYVTGKVFTHQRPVEQY